MKTRIILNVFYNPSRCLEKFVETCGQLYLPVNGGSKLCQPGSWAEKWLGRDDSDENVSDMNGELNELTSVYWAWKNYDWTDVDFVGFNHYRRFFDPTVLRGAGKWDLLVGKPIRFNVNLLQQYSKAHSRSHIRRLAELVEKQLPGSGFREWLSSRELFAPCNMLVARKDLFFDWCEFIFPFVFKLRGELKLKKNLYQHRAIAFLSERLTSFWAWRQATNRKTRVEQAKIVFLKNTVENRNEDSSRMHSQA